MGLPKNCRAGHVYLSIKLCCLFGANVCHLPQLLPKGWPRQPHSTQWVLEAVLVSPTSSPLCRNDAAHFHQFSKGPEVTGKARLWCESDFNPRPVPSRWVTLGDSYHLFAPQFTHPQNEGDTTYLSQGLVPPTECFGESLINRLFVSRG